MGTSDSELVQKIETLKKNRNALIVAHNFQPGDIQDIADKVGDTLELSRYAAEASANTIVVCGVDYVAETVALFCPDKTILLPEQGARCPLAEMITAERLREKKKQNPGAKVVCYLKSPVEVKAEADICCTSANTIEVISGLNRREPVIFVPDQYLGDYFCTETGDEIILWPGYCPSHFKIEPEDITQLKSVHPQAKIVVHPSCTPQVRALADAVLSTAEIIRFVRDSEAKEIIVGTEIGLMHRLRKENPDKIIIPAAERAICGKMRLITLESILWSLENLTHVVKIPEDIRIKAKQAIDRGMKVLR